VKRSLSYETTPCMSVKTNQHFGGIVSFISTTGAKYKQGERILKMDTFLRNTDWLSPNYAALHPVRYKLTSLKMTTALNSTKHFLTYKPDRAIAQAVSRRLPIAAARVRAQVTSCGICDGRSGTGAGFFRVIRFPFRSTSCSTVTIIYHLRLVQQAKQWPQFEVDSVSPHEKKNVQT
jgi:hypothetical protein